MGGIDLDPASSDRANQHVRAGQYYTARRSGLAHDWFGRVWLNPPYAMPLIRQFVARMCTAFVAGQFSEGILLTNSATDTTWWDLAHRTSQATCLTRGRIRFLEAKEGELVERPAPMLGQTFFYFGVQRDSFAEVFAQFGNIVWPQVYYGQCG
jgi:DNA N-6-adenine-methyltransferase (Dam)